MACAASIIWASGRVRCREVTYVNTCVEAMAIGGAIHPFNPIIVAIHASLNAKTLETTIRMVSSARNEMGRLVSRCASSRPLSDSMVGITAPAVQTRSRPHARS